MTTTRTVRVVTAGPQGATGAQGPTGPQGPQGPAGAGGVAVDNVPNPFEAPYLLKGDGVTDDSDGMQLWADDCVALGAPVIFPGTGDMRWALPAGFIGTYYHTRPLIVTASGTTLGFASPGAGKFFTRGGTPHIHLYPGLTQGPRLVASLATGPGNAWRMGNVPGDPPEQNNSWINARDIWNAAVLKGLTSFTFECFYELEETVTNAATFLAGSSGSLFGALGGSLKTAFVVQYLPDFTGNAPRASIRTSTGTYTAVSSVPFTVGTTHHFAVVYNGATSTLKIYVDRVETASVAATGTILQEPFEGFFVGHWRPGFPEASTVSVAPRAKIDNVCLFKTARYTSNGTKPTAKYEYPWPQTADVSGCLFVCNFENPLGPFVKVRHAWPEDAANQGGYLEIKNGASSTLQGNRVRLQNLEIQGGSIGISARAMTEISVVDTRITDVRGVGILFNDNCYFARISGVDAMHCTRGGMWFHTASGAMSIRDSKAIAGDYPLVLAYGQLNSQFSNVTVGTGQTHVSALIKDDGGMSVQIEGLSFDDEELDDGRWGYFAMLAVSGVARFRLRGGQLYSLSHANTAPAIYFNSADATHGEHATIEDSVLEPHPTAPAVFAFGEWASNDPVRYGRDIRVPSYNGVPLVAAGDEDKVEEIP